MSGDTDKLSEEELAALEKKLGFGDAGAGDAGDARGDAGEGEGTSGSSPGAGTRTPPAAQAPLGTPDAPLPFYESIQVMLQDFNRLFIQVLIGNCPHVAWEHDNIVTYFPYKHFHEQFSYVRCANPLFGPGNKIESQLTPTRYWLNWSHKRSCRGIKFYPASVDPNDPEGRFYNH
jgi:hypothetical protein